MRMNGSVAVVSAVFGTLFGIALGWTSRGAEMAASSSPGDPLRATSASGLEAAPSSAPATLSEARERILRLELEIEAQARTIEELRGATAEGQGPVGSPAAAVPPPVKPPAGPAGASDSVPPGRSPAEVLRRVDEIREEIEEAFGSGDGKRALTLLRELGSLGAPAYDLAVSLARRLEKDVEGDNLLDVSRIALHKVLGSPEFIPLLKHAVTTANVDRSFRQTAASSLVWKNAPETTALFLKQMSVEKDDRLFRQMADAVAELREPAAVSGLIELFGRRPDRAPFRMALIGAIEDLSDPLVDQKLQSLASIDPDPKVRTAARVSYVGRNPPEAGFLVSQVAGKTQAAKAGLQPGDIIVRYNDQPLGADNELGRLVRGVPGNQTVSLLVLRNGQYQTFGIKGGKIGVDGRAVRPRSAR